MKKIYNFFALMLCFLAGTVTSTADDTGGLDEVKWVISENTVTDFHDGLKVVLQQGTYSSWSSSGYLNPSGAYKAAVDASCVYEVKEVGKAKDDGSTLYVFKNVSNGQYIYSGGHTLSYSDAFQCSAYLAKIGAENRRALISGPDKQSADAEGVCWVFASAVANENGEYTYLCYWDCPAYSTYWDTNDWFVYEATARPKTAQEKLEEVYNEVFPQGFSAEQFPVGNQPGYMTQECYDKLHAAYEAANEILGVEGTSDDKVLAVVKQIEEAQKLKEGSGLIKPQPGQYYTFINQRSQDYMYDAGTSLKCTRAYTLSDPLTASDAKYVWSVEDAGDGLYYLKNFATGRYMGQQGTSSTIFPTTEKAEVKVQIPFYSGGLFLLKDESGNAAHNDGSYNVVRWQSTGEANQWAIRTVDAEQVKAITAQIEKNNFITKLYSLLADAKSTKENLSYDSDVTFDGNYAKEGLVNTMTGNRTETSEGSIAGAFDGDLTTYYHTVWSSTAAFDDYDWVQVDLGKEVQHLFLKMTQRHNNTGGSPRRIFLVAPAAGDDPAGVWTDTIYRDTVIYDFTTNYPAGARKNSTAVIKLDFDKTVRNLRLGVYATVDMGFHGGKSPCWHAAEIRFYENNGTNPRYELIPEAVRAELDAQIANATAKLADSTCVQDDYDKLEAALKALNEAYPDDSHLQSLIEEAEAQAAAEGVTGTGLGYFPAGAQDALTADINTVKTAIEGKTLTLAQIDEYLTAVRKAISTFNAKLIVPEDGAVIRIKSETINDAGEPAAANGNYVYATNADTTANVTWGYKDDENAESRLDAIWQVTKNADGTFAFRNLATGRYIHNPYTGVADPDDISLSSQLMSGDKAESFTFVSAKEGGKFVIQMAEGVYFNADPNGGIVNWNTSTGNSVFSVSLAETDYLANHTLTVGANKLQVVSVPFAVKGVTPTAYKVLGQKAGDDGANYLQLASYDESEVIPAGTPFIIQTAEDETFAQLMLVDEGNDFLNTQYVHTPVVQKGLTSVFLATKVKAGLGLLLDGVVKNSVDGTAVASGSGYFTEIPETTEDGEITVKIEDVINGIATAPVATADTPVSVYTLSGIKVRSNVKAANATNGLPAGLYIVGGKKILVK